ALLAGGHQRDHRRGSTRAVSVRCRAGLRSPSTGSRRRVAAWRREPPFRTAAPREGEPGGAGLEERKAGGTAPHGGSRGSRGPGPGKPAIAEANPEKPGLAEGNPEKSGFHRAGSVSASEALDACARGPGRCKELG